MPYIKDYDRASIQAGHTPTTAGELNFLLTMVCKAYMEHGESYQRYNDCMGALTGCLLELYRRRVGPYEDTKIKENGDVW